LEAISTGISARIPVRISPGIRKRYGSGFSTRFSDRFRAGFWMGPSTSYSARISPVILDRYSPVFRGRIPPSISPQIREGLRAG
jgi:hypothetical protein